MDRPLFPAQSPISGSRRFQALAGETFVGRKADVAKIQKVLSGEHRAKGSLSVMSIEGPGGIGKTALFDHTVHSTHLGPRRFLTMRISTKENPQAATPFTFIDTMISTAKADAIADKPAGHYFPHAKLALSAVDEVRTQVASEIEQRFSTDLELKAVLMKGAVEMLAHGHSLADFHAVVTKRPDFQAIEKRLDRGMVDRNLRAFKSVKPESGWIKRLMPGTGNASLRNSIRENAIKAVADALLLDLSRLLSGKTKKEGVDRLLLVVDDYEFLMKPLGDFLVRFLFPGLRDAEFPTTAFLIGRDKLIATHQHWNKELAGVIVDRITLKVFELPEFVELCRMSGVTDAPQRDRIWQETGGYPYLVRLLLEELAEQRAEGLDGPSALMLKSFYDRTTRFMSDEQRGWLEKVLFLDHVDKRTLRAFFSDPAEIDRVQDWFESEPSIRDPNSSLFRVRDQLKSRLKEYLSRKDPDRFDSLEATASAVGK
jgi:predicted NAD-dependent protein-ADP-ribosyltransferase YbiA (DUF1768 family)